MLSYDTELRRYEKYFKKIFGFGTDYTYKSFVIGNNINTEVNKISWNSHINIVTNGIGLYDDEVLDLWYNSLADRFGFISILEAIRVNNARSHRVCRLKNRVESIISKPSLFLTLTFTNDCLSSTSDITRRRYVTRFLKSISNNYVANIDYGKRNHREHYHAVVECEKVDHKLWKYGAINFERITYEDVSDVTKLSKYVAKLTNHAIKETNKRCCLIYPKKNFKNILTTSDN